MDFIELVKKRYSVRAYMSDPVEENKLQQILEAARLAPTAANRQPFGIIVIRTEGREADLKRMYHRDWLFQAPLVLGICSETSSAWTRSDGKNYANVDATIVMDHIILAATDLGLGTCWIGAFDPKVTRDICGLPEGVEPVAFTPLGYPADEAKPKIRKNLSQLVHYERW